MGLRRSASEVLLLGLRDAGHWQDASVGGAYLDSTAGGPTPDGVRANVRGLGVEYVPLEADGSWGPKGLLDFNLQTRDWPDALPEARGSAPRSASLGPGRALFRLRAAQQGGGGSSVMPCMRSGRVDGTA